MKVTVTVAITVSRPAKLCATPATHGFLFSAIPDGRICMLDNYFSCSSKYDEYRS